jgi:hypothetical protein
LPAVGGNGAADERDEPPLISFVSQACDILSGRVAHLWNKETEMNNKGSSLTPAQALEKLDALYEQSVKRCAAPSANISKQGNFPTKRPEPRAFLFIHRSL